jgi:DMSO/TMAO reductase YedYZ molybdopterin-dependent catalytic subunit
MIKLGIATTRREFLRSSPLLGAACLTGFNNVCGITDYLSETQDSLRVGTECASLGVLDFLEEGRAPLDTPFNEELDGRLYTDLSTLTPERPLTPTEKFYIRTRCSKLFDYGKPWTVKMTGLVEQPVILPLERLHAMTVPTGVHLMECAGNGRATRFAMLSVADWAGVPISELFKLVKIQPRAARVMVSAFDRYLTQSKGSVAGAAWIFTIQELSSSKAFLATKMNGKPLTPDHGAPVRLVVPGHYGCSCIKWVNEIALVADDVEASSQMQEFAARTHQQGVPKLAREYRTATIDQAAMPVRIEKCLVGGKIRYRVAGILWGGSQPITVLEIRFNPEEHYVRVDRVQQTKNDPWSFWSHDWTPTHTGTHLIRLRVKDPLVATRRLDSGYYVRSVEIREV